jgi:hypothetical protein
MISPAAARRKQARRRPNPQAADSHQGRREFLTNRAAGNGISRAVPVESLFPNAYGLAAAFGNGVPIRSIALWRLREQGAAVNPTGADREPRQPIAAFAGRKAG